MVTAKPLRSRRFPLTHHPTGQSCKRIRGKLYYFRSGKQAAYERYLRESADLHGGMPLGAKVNRGVMTVKNPGNHYLAHQHERMTSNDLAETGDSQRAPE